MVCVTYVNHRKPRYFGAAQMTNFSALLYGENERRSQKRQRVELSGSYTHDTQFLFRFIGIENSLGVKVDTNPFCILGGTW